MHISDWNDDKLPAISPRVDVVLTNGARYRFYPHTPTSSKSIRPDGYDCRHCYKRGVGKPTVFEGKKYHKGCAVRYQKERI